MKNQALFSSKDKSKKLKRRLLQFLFGALRVKTCWTVNNSAIVFMLASTSVSVFVCTSELQIRGSTEDNSKIIFLISQRKHML